MSSITRERFETGLTYDAYRAQLTQYRDEFLRYEAAVALTEADLAPFRALERPLNVLVLAEDWCGDCFRNIPVLGRLAAASGKLDIRVFKRDENLDLMDQFLNQGRFRSIPVFVFLDAAFREVGHFIERPASVTAWRIERRKALHAAHPEFGPFDAPPATLEPETRDRLSAAIRAIYEESMPFSNAEVIRELQAIVAVYRAAL